MFIRTLGGYGIITVTRWELVLFRHFCERVRESDRHRTRMTRHVYPDYVLFSYLSKHRRHFYRAWKYTWGFIESACGNASLL
jgi:hypothetical protein